MDMKRTVCDNNGYIWVSCSFACFVCTNYVLGLFVPSNARRTSHHIWKWKNISTSFLHSFISGIWAMMCFWRVPEMKEDLINNYSLSARGVISLSVGYFIYDLLDMAIHDYKRSADLLIHHCLVILCFGLSVCTCFYQGYSLIALLVEVNSIFLHLRQLMLLQGIKKSSTVYKANGLLNLVTFVIFRVFTMGGMFHWLLSHRADLTATVFGLGVFSLIVITGMNFQLLFRVWKSDYKRRSSNSSKESAAHHPHSEKQSNGECVVNHNLGDHQISQNRKASKENVSELPSPIVNGKILKTE